MVAHLNLHTAYDLLNSSLRIDDVVKKHNIIIMIH